jgi:hypothetical protein
MRAGWGSSQVPMGHFALRSTVMSTTISSSAMLDSRFSGSASSGTASIAGSVEDKRFQAASNTLKTTAVRRSNLDLWWSAHTCAQHRLVRITIVPIRGCQSIDMVGNCENVTATYAAVYALSNLAMGTG